MDNIWTRFHPDIIKLTSYMAFFIECKYQAALGNSEFYGWIGYGGVRFARVECIDYDGNHVVPMGFEEYKHWNDSDFWQNPGKAFMENEDLFPINSPLPESLLKHFNNV